MHPLKAITKYSLVFFCAAGGVLSLSRGFGMPIPFLEYGAAETWNVFAGAALLAAAACVAVFWHVGRPAEKKPVTPPMAGDEWLFQDSRTIPRKF